MLGDAAGWLARAQAQHPPAIVSISVCGAHGAGGPGSCPSGSFDTHQIVLAPDGSGNAINKYGGLGGISDEHSTVFSPGTLQGNSDYLFFVATRTSLNSDTGVVVLSGGRGPNQATGQWTMDFPKADGYDSYPSGFGQLFLSPVGRGCPTVADGNPAHQDRTFDLNYAAAGSVVIDPTSGPGNLLMIYEGTNTCFGVTGGDRSDNFYSTVGVATSRDYGYTWPTYRGSASFDFARLPSQNQSQGPNAPAGSLGNSVCSGNDCSATPPASYGRYAVLGPQVTIATAMATGKPLPATMGDAQPSAFVDDASARPAQYLYEVHGYSPGGLGDPPLPNNLDSDLMVARARLNGGTAPLSFVKWNGRAFAAPGLGGLESPIFPAGPYKNCETQDQGRHSGSIDYVEATQQYLLTFVCHSPTDPASGQGAGNAKGAAWFYSTSDDLSDPGQWSPPQEVIGSWSEWDSSGGCRDYKGWYPSLMSPGSKPGHLSTSGYVFYMWGCQGVSARQFSSRAFTITTGTPAPTISLVANAEGESPTIAPNTWVEIKGSNLAPAGDKRTWQSSDFVNNKMPTQLDGVSATVNNRAAYVYYISPAQVNILTPPDAISGPVQVVVTSAGVASAPETVQAEPFSPSFFVFNGGPHVAAVHANGSLIGPTTLYQGSTTPAKPGETVLLYANGFGPTNVPVASGATTQWGTLSPVPVIKIGGITATVSFAGLVAPGEFQFNVVVPPNTPDGDQPIRATYSGATTQPGTLITVQH